MQLTIKNFRGLTEAELPLDKPALIAGRNGSGKTSLAMAIAAACSGAAAPWTDVKAKDAKDLLRNGSKRGHVTVTAGEQSVNVNYPGGSVTGEPPFFVSPFALGLESVATMKPADATMILAEYMQAEPTQADLAEAVGEAVAAQVWPVITADGWDTALARAKESGSRLKGQWEGVTGENYGSAKARGWQPEGADAYDLSQDLQAELDRANATLQQMLANQAVGEDRKRQLAEQVERGLAARGWLKDRHLNPDMTPEQHQQEMQRLRTESSMAQQQVQQRQKMDEWARLAETVPELASSRQALERQLGEARQTLEQAQAALEQLPKPGDKVQTAPCPSCGTHLVVVSRSTLAMPEGQISDEENAQRAEGIAKAQAALQLAGDQVADLERQLAGTHAELTRAERAAEDLKLVDIGQAPADLDAIVQQINLLSEAAGQLRDVGDGNQAEGELAKLEGATGHSQEAIEAARAAVSEAEYVLSLKQAMDRAGKLAGQIARNAEIVAALQPTGVRQVVLNRALESFNARLTEISAIAHWQPVKIDGNMRISYGDREYGWRLSESEKFRCRVVLQMAMAEADSSPIIVVDAADILDGPGRNGLLMLVKKSDRPVMMTMTMNKQEDVPNLQKLGIASYWINHETGELLPV